MESSEKTIVSFIQLLKSSDIHLSIRDIQELSLLGEQLSDDPEQISQAILFWCEAHPSIFSALRKIRKSLSKKIYERGDSNFSEEINMSSRSFKSEVRESIQIALEKHSNSSIDVTSNVISESNQTTNRETESLTYYTDISCPRQICQKTQRFSVIVRLKIQYPEYSDAPIGELSVDPNLPVRVRINAPDFNILSVTEQEIVLHPNPNIDSDLLVFDLQPRQKIGMTRITFDFFQSGNPIGKVVSFPVEITTIEAINKSIYQEKIILNSQYILQAPDLTLYINYESFQKSPSLCFTLIKKGEIGRDFYPILLNENPKKYTHLLYKNLVNLKTLNTINIDRELHNLGYKLWDDLIPNEFKKFYADNRQKLKNCTLLVVSDEPYIPWELIWPYDEYNQWEDEAPWCITLKLTRWLRRDYQGNGHEVASGLLSLKNFACIAPQEAGLTYAQQEQQFLKEEIRKHHLNDLSPKTTYLAEIRNLLEGSQYNWLHIASHGNFDSEEPDNSSRIFLNKKENLVINDLRGPKIKGHIHKSRPGFFFNTCHSGRQAWALTGLGGWANHLISSGAGLFLAPLWTVSDDLAFVFSQTFYQELLKEKTVAEAVLSARLASRRPGNSTWLAYSVYAHPNAQIRMGKKSIL